MLFLLLDFYIYFLCIEYKSYTFILRQSDKAIYRELDDIEFIHFYQMDGIAIWIYTIFSNVVCENKDLKEANLSGKFQRRLC